MLSNRSGGAALASAFLWTFSMGQASPLATIYSNVANPLNPSQIAFSNPVCTIPFSNTSSGFSPCGATDNFGAVITSNISVSSNGPVTFRTGSDDGSYLYVDGTLVVNNGFYQGLTERSGTINLTPGTHSLMVQYFQGGGGSGLTVTLPAGTAYLDSGLITATAYSSYTDPTDPALFALINPACTFQVDAINYPSGGGPSFSPCGLSDNFGVSFRGRFNLANSGQHTFATSSDDGSYFFVNGNLVVNNGFFQGMTRREGTVNLAAGTYDFEVRYFQGGGGSGIIAEFPADAVFIPERSTALLSLTGLAALLAWHRVRPNQNAASIRTPWPSVGPAKVWDEGLDSRG